MNNIRIKDVAEHAQVSVATITRVINNSGYVSEQTRKRVLESIHELGYIPNRMASALKNNSTRIIGNVVPFIDINPFFTSVGASISGYAQQHGYRILTMATNSDPKMEAALIHDLIGRMVEGIIFTGDMASKPENIQAILDKRIPVIMIERPLDMYGVDKVLINDMEGSALAAERFLSCGHTRVAFVGKQRTSRVETDRFEGFRQTMERRGCKVNEQDIFFVEDYKTEMGYRAVKELFSRHTGHSDMPSAFFFASDILACGGLQYFYERGLRVPADVSVIGYDNTLSSVTSPPISSVAFPIDEIGKTVIHLFFERKEDDRNFGKSVELSPFFTDRSSVRDFR